MGDAQSQEALRYREDGKLNAQSLQAQLQLHQTPGRQSLELAAVAAARASGGDMQQDPVLLTQLVHLLASRQKQSLLLSDFGALLPANLRQSVKDKGGLRSWLQKYPDLFKVIGQPGKESVALAFQVGRDKDFAGAAAACRDSLAAASAAAEDAQKKHADEEEDNESAVQLRGLPYKATVSDIRGFLGRHAENMRSESSPIQLVLNRDGRPSGFARVNFKSPAAAKAARDELHMSVIRPSNAAGSTDSSQLAADASGNERYVEIFLFSERPNKLRFKKTVTLDAPVQQEDDSSIICADQEQVINELRVHMSSPGKAQLLLSMLGVALSQGSRKYLKKTDQGLKHFLSQYPQEFSVEGQKGRECVTYLPAMNDEDNAAGNDPPRNDATVPIQELPKVTPAFQELPKASPIMQELPKAAPSCMDQALPSSPLSRAPMEPNFVGAQRCPIGSGGPVRGHFNDLLRPPEDIAFLPESPMPSSSPRGAALQRTPSDWGTPQLFPTYQGGRIGLSNETPTPSTSVGVSTQDQLFGSWGAWSNLPGGLGSLAPAAMWAPSGMPPTPWGGLPPGTDPRLAQLVSSQQGNGSGTKPAGSDAVAKGATKARAANSLDEQNFAIRLRGLPANATEQDVLAFFAKHDVVHLIADGRNAVRLPGSGKGKPTGHVVVEMRSRSAAAHALAALHGQWISNRYIEVLETEETNSDADDRLGGDVSMAPMTRPFARGAASPWTAPQSSDSLFDHFGEADVSVGASAASPFRQWPQGIHNDRRPLSSNEQQRQQQQRRPLTQRQPQPQMQQQQLQQQLQQQHRQQLLQRQQLQQRQPQQHIQQQQALQGQHQQHQQQQHWQEQQQQSQPFPVGAISPPAASEVPPFGMTGHSSYEPMQNGEPQPWKHLFDFLHKQNGESTPPCGPLPGAGGMRRKLPSNASWQVVPGD